MRFGSFLAVIVLAGSVSLAGVRGHAAEALKALILDGENPSHDWQTTTPLLKKILEDSGRFKVDVATFPKPGSEEFAAFCPKFSDYDVVVGNYNSQAMPSDAFKKAFLEFVRAGGGYVPIHAADNSWARWPEYNEMCGIGGWFGRNEEWGPYVYYKDDELVRDDAPGRGGSHGRQHKYVVKLRDAENPIVKGLPEEWLHTQDELYDRLRGPAKDMHILATAYSDPKTGGTGRHEPMLMTLTYGDGRVFHTVLGHADYSMTCVGFITTLLRGTEWAATGAVTIPVPEDFPTKEEAKSRE
jgi:type 1 glutamine amidotransferase